MKGRPNKRKLIRVFVDYNNSVQIFDTSSKSSLKESIEKNKNMIIPIKETIIHKDDINMSNEINLEQQNQINQFNIINNKSLIDNDQIINFDGVNSFNITDINNKNQYFEFNEIEDDFFTYFLPFDF